MKKSCVAACPVEWPDGRGISGRMRVEWVAGSAWNRWSDAHGMGGQMTVESAGQRLIWRYASVEKGLKLHTYWSSHCQSCELKAQCTPSTQRRVRRWEHESVLENMQHRLDQAPEMMRIRKQTVEHPFGTLKAWMGATHFLTRTLPRVSTEMSLHVLAYNIKRVIKILGSAALIEAITA